MSIVKKRKQLTVRSNAQQPCCDDHGPCSTNAHHCNFAVEVKLLRANSYHRMHSVIAAIPHTSNTSSSHPQLNFA
jgi:hypothetical protein